MPNLVILKNGRKKSLNVPKLGSNVPGGELADKLGQNMQVCVKKHYLSKPNFLEDFPAARVRVAQFRGNVKAQLKEIPSGKEFISELQEAMKEEIESLCRDLTSMTAMNFAVISSFDTDGKEVLHPPSSEESYRNKVDWNFAHALYSWHRFWNRSWDGRRRTQTGKSGIREIVVRQAKKAGLW